MIRVEVPVPIVKKKNRVATEERMQAGIGNILETKGHSGMTVNKVFKHLGIAKTAMYRDFESFNNLITTYYESIDVRLEPLLVDVSTITTEALIDLLMNAIEKNYLFLAQSKIIREFCAWELSDKSEMFEKQIKARDAVHLKFLEKIKPCLKDNGIKFDAVYAIIYAATNSLVLENKMFPGSHYGYNVGNEQKRNELFTTFRQLITYALS